LNAIQDKLLQECQGGCARGITDLRAKMSRIEQTILGYSECKRNEMATLLHNQQAKHTASLDEQKRILLEIHASINRGVLVPNSSNYMQPSTPSLSTTPNAGMRIGTQLRIFLGSVVQYTSQHGLRFGLINLNYKAFRCNVISTASTGLRLIDLRVQLDAATIAWLKKW